MFNVVYQGVDTLDLADQGALPQTVLDQLEDARNFAEAQQNDKHGEPVLLGPNQRKFFVKAHGKKGGYRYTLIDDPTGAIFSIKRDTRPQIWSFFVSARAAGLLSRSYEGMKQHILDCLTDMGATLGEVSVNRLDYAIDIATPEFVLDMRNFIAPRKAKIGCYFSNDYDLDDFGDKIPKSHPEPLPVGSIMRGGRFESVTMGKMPGRQVIIYDKMQAAKDLKTDYWFPAWGIHKDDPAIQVWRVEIRAGREALKRYIQAPNTRTFENVEAVLPAFLQEALSEIRYVLERLDDSNVTCSEVHPLWTTAQEAAKRLPAGDRPALPPSYVLELMRKNLHAMAEAQAFGNLNNLLTLEGMTPEQIEADFQKLAAQRAAIYQERLEGGLHTTKLERGATRLSVYLDHQR